MTQAPRVQSTLSCIQSIFFMSMVVIVPYMIRNVFSPSTNGPTIAEQSIAAGKVVTLLKYKRVLDLVKHSMLNKDLSTGYHETNLKSSYDFKGILAECRGFGAGIRYTPMMQLLVACDETMDAVALGLMKFDPVNGTEVVDDLSEGDPEGIYNGDLHAKECRDVDRTVYARFRNKIIRELIGRGVTAGPFNETNKMNYEKAIIVGNEYRARLSTNIPEVERNSLEKHMQICAHAVFSLETTKAERVGKNEALFLTFQAIAYSTMFVGIMAYLQNPFKIPLLVVGAMSLPAALVMVIPLLPSMDQINGVVQDPIVLAGFLAALYAAYNVTMKG